MQITSKQFAELFPTNKQPDTWAVTLNAILPEYNIITIPRIAAFLAQCGHESMGFTRLVENLNYSADALRRTWPKRFPGAVADQYARQPERIANRAYADRMGNGPEESGDGWRYRGRGLIQLTGADRYRAFAQDMGRFLRDIPAYLETPEGATESACWYWIGNNLHRFADIPDLRMMTRVINGGYNGLDDRKKRYAQTLKVLGMGVV